MSAVLGLQKVELFSGLDSASLREIALQCKWTRCKRNEIVIRRGGTDRDVYFVIAGQVRVAAPAGRGRRIIFRDVTPGDLFGEHSAIDGRSRFTDVVAVRESLLASMPAEVFRAILANHAPVRERLLRRLSGAVRELADRLVELGASRVQARVWMEVLRLARAAGVVDNMATIERAPTHNEIASRVGTSREEVTREFSRLARQGLLERQGRSLLVRDVAGFEQLVAETRPDEPPAPPASPEDWRPLAGLGAQRQRRALLVADALDSVGLMERDEERTLDRWRNFFAHATAQLIPTHAGRSLSRTLSNGFLAEFPDGGHAARCAFELHQDLARSNAAASAPPLGLRIGIHVADVIVESFNVVGDGVNVAARLAELANAGETVVSAAVRDQLTSGIEATVEDLGEQRLRNRERPVRAFRLWPPAQEGAAAAAPGARRAHGRPSVAVIPFRLLTEDARFAFVGDGLADETIAALSRVADFFVTSRLSSMAFRHAPLGARSIGEMLGVQYVLSGSVQAAHPRALFLAELADTRDGRIVWSERFEGDLADVFAMQGELARKVAQSMAPVVRSVELRRARITSFADLDAYGMTLRGVELMHRLSREDFLAARHAFQTAIERNPVSPAPHAWLAKWHVIRIALGASPDVAEDYAAASACTQRALACDPEDALALAVDALVAGWRHDLDAAERDLAQALAANPNEPLAWLHSAITHAWRGRGAEAVRCAEQALSLSPLDPMIYYFNSLAGMANLIAEHYERAIELSTRSLRENRLHTPTLRTLAAAYALLGRMDEARNTMAELRSLEPALTAGVLRERYPGRDSPQATRFISALVEAGLPP